MRITVDPQKPGEMKVRSHGRSGKPGYNEIAARAYQLYEQDGRPQGKDLEHWFRAEEMVAGESEPSKSRRA